MLDCKQAERERSSAAAGTAATETHLLLHRKQLDDVLVVEFLQNLELSHLDVQRTQEAQVVEHLDGVQVACFLPHKQSWTALKRVDHAAVLGDSTLSPPSLSLCWTRPDPLSLSHLRLYTFT